MSNELKKELKIAGTYLLTALIIVVAFFVVTIMFKIATEWMWYLASSDNWIFPEQHKQDE